MVVLDLPRDQAPLSADDAVPLEAIDA